MALKEIFTGSIDCALIDKNRIKTVTKKDGTIAKYLDIQIFINDEADERNQIGSITVNQTKEESEAKVKKTYLGNLKRTYGGNKPPQNTTPQTFDNTSELDSLPF